MTGVVESKKSGRKQAKVDLSKRFLEPIAEENKPPKSTKSGKSKNQGTVKAVQPPTTAIDLQHADLFKSKRKSSSGSAQQTTAVNNDHYSIDGNSSSFQSNGGGSNCNFKIHQAQPSINRHQKDYQHQQWVRSDSGPAQHTSTMTNGVYSSLQTNHEGGSQVQPINNNHQGSSSTGGGSVAQALHPNNQQSGILVNSNHYHNSHNNAHWTTGPMEEGYNGMQRNYSQNHDQGHQGFMQGSYHGQFNSQPGTSQGLYSHNQELWNQQPYNSNQQQWRHNTGAATSNDLWSKVYGGPQAVGAYPVEAATPLETPENKEFASLFPCFAPPKNLALVKYVKTAPDLPQPTTPTVSIQPSAASASKDVVALNSSSASEKTTEDDPSIVPVCTAQREVKAAWFGEPAMSDEEFNYKFRRMYTMLQMVSGLKLGGANGNEELASSLKIWPFPISDHARLGALNSQLEVEEEKLLLISYLSKIGGKNTDDVVWKVMKHIMEKSVAQRYTLYGFGQRSRFDKYNNLLYCIKAGVQLFDKTASLDDITTRIGKYFTYVNERPRIVKVVGAMKTPGKRIQDSPVKKQRMLQQQEDTYSSESDTESVKEDPTSGIIMCPSDSSFSDDGDQLSVEY